MQISKGIIFINKQPPPLIMNQKTENQDITSKQQDFSPDDLLTGKVVVDEISIEQMNQVQKFLEDKYSSKVDAIVKDLEDDPDEDNIWKRTYLQRPSPLHFRLSVGRRQMNFILSFNDTEHYSYEHEPISKYNEVVINFEDGVTTRSAYGTKAFDNIQRKRKIKHISKLEPTINEILDRQLELIEPERKAFLENRQRLVKEKAREHLDDLEEELETVKSFLKKYQIHFLNERTLGFNAIIDDIDKKIVAEKAKLKEAGLF